MTRQISIHHRLLGSLLFANQKQQDPMGDGSSFQPDYKGKGKARDLERDEESVSPPLPEGGYPPTAEEEAEARKVEEVRHH